MAYHYVFALVCAHAHVHGCVWCVCQVLKYSLCWGDCCIYYSLCHLATFMYLYNDSLHVFAELQELAGHHCHPGYG